MFSFFVAVLSSLIRLLGSFDIFIDWVLEVCRSLVCFVMFILFRVGVVFVVFFKLKKIKNVLGFNEIVLFVIVNRIILLNFSIFFVFFDLGDIINVVFILDNVDIIK